MNTRATSLTDGSRMAHGKANALGCPAFSRMHPPMLKAGGTTSRPSRGGYPGSRAEVARPPNARACPAWGCPENAPRFWKASEIQPGQKVGRGRGPGGGLGTGGWIS